MKIEIKNLNKNYNNILAVKNINFNINKGSIVGLLGPNGCGKTTTGRICRIFLMPAPIFWLYVRLSNTGNIKSVDIIKSLTFEDSRSLNTTLLFSFDKLNQRP